MKKVIAWLLVLSLTAAVSIGATLAYLTDTDEDVNVMTLGKVKIDQLEYERKDDETADAEAKVQEFHDNKPLYPAITGENFDYSPGDTYVDWTQIGKDGYISEIWDPTQINNELDKMVFVKNKGDYDAHVRSWIAFEAGNYTVEEFKELFHLNINETDWTWEWQDTVVAIPGENGATTNYVVAVATYNKVLKPGQLTEISLSQIALDSSVGNEDIKVFGDTYQVLVKTQAIQADGFETAVMALSEGFGTAHPFKTDTPIKGIDVRTALHNLNGDPKQVITTKIKNVIFGKTADHRDIANGYDGVLVDQEQDVPVYTYYVPNGNGYDVYFLAEDEVFLPKNSNRLFQGMSALTAVDTSNLNTGRAEDMGYLFYLCPALKEIDVSGFDTSRATTLRSAFNGCTVLPNVDVSNWDTSKVTDMSNLFKNCNAMTELDLTGLDMDSLEYAEYIFNRCYNLQKVDTTGWDISNVLSTCGMFMNCYSLKTVEGMSDWYMPNNQNLYYMFQKCGFETIDVSGWNCSSVQNMNGTFFSCQSLKSIEGLENWDTSKVTTMRDMFELCSKLESVEGLGNFNTSKVEDMAFMFYACHALKDYDIGGWDTSNVKYFNSMFSDGGHNTGWMTVTYLPVEDWDVSSAVNMECMFYNCGHLLELDLSKWRPAKVTNFRHTFADCFRLQSIDLTGWTTESATTFDGLFNDCYSLTELDVSDLDTGNCTNFAQFFEGCGGLKTVKGMENWDVSKVVTMSEFFNANGKDMHLEYVDLSAFNTLSLKDVESMFNGCYRLKTVYVGDGWDTSKVTDTANMFAGCSSLVGGAGTVFRGSDLKYACVDGGETAPGYFTHINDRVTE